MILGGPSGPPFFFAPGRFVRHPPVASRGGESARFSPRRSVSGQRAGEPMGRWLGTVIREI